jgi:hypothetical protein
MEGLCRTLLGGGGGGGTGGGRDKDSIKAPLLLRAVVK